MFEMLRGTGNFLKWVGKKLASVWDLAFIILLIAFSVIGPWFLPTVQTEEILWLGMVGFAIFRIHTPAIHQARIDVFDAKNNNHHLQPVVRGMALDIARTRLAVERWFRAGQVIFALAAVRGIFTEPSVDRVRWETIVVIAFLMTGNLCIVLASLIWNRGRDHIRSVRLNLPPPKGGI